MIFFVFTKLEILEKLFSFECENGKRVDSFICHPRVLALLLGEAEKMFMETLML